MITTLLLIQYLLPSSILIFAILGVAAHGGRVADGGAEMGGGGDIGGGGGGELPWEGGGGGGELPWEGGCWVLVEVTTLPPVFIGQLSYQSQHDCLTNISKWFGNLGSGFFLSPNLDPCSVNGRLKKL